MSSRGFSYAPPVFTPVFDASNRWAAIRVHAEQPDPQLLAALDSRIGANPDDGIGKHLARVPFLLSGNDVRRWLPPTAPDSFLCKVVFLIPPVAEASVPELRNECLPREMLTMLDGLPAARGDGLPLCIDMAAGFNGDAQGWLSKSPGPHLARNIGDAALHRQCVKAGYTWFEGYWPLQPDPAKAAHSDTSRSTLLKLLGLVSNDADASELEALLKRDAHLSYQLLKMVNSVNFALRQKITNFSQAITLLGRRQLQRWVQLLLFAGNHGDGNVSALFSIAARRAAFMEHACAALGGKQDEQDRAFMVGLFSLLDVLLAAPLDDLIAPLNLDDAVTDALIAGEGRLGKLLALAVATESLPDAALSQRLESLTIGQDAFVAIQLRAMAWAVQVSGEMQ